MRLIAVIVSVDGAADAAPSKASPRRRHLRDDHHLHGHQRRNPTTRAPFAVTAAALELIQVVRFTRRQRLVSCCCSVTHTTPQRAAAALGRRAPGHGRLHGTFNGALSPSLRPPWPPSSHSIGSTLSDAQFQFALPVAATLKHHLSSVRPRPADHNGHAKACRRVICFYRTLLLCPR